MIDRKKTLLHRYVTKPIQIQKEVVLVNKVIADENGRPQTISQKIVDDSQARLDKVPAYSCDIEYMQLYGTLNDMTSPQKMPNICNGFFSGREIENRVRSIIKDNFERKMVEQEETNKRIETPKND